MVLRSRSALFTHSSFVSARVSLLCPAARSDGVGRLSASLSVRSAVCLLASLSVSLSVRLSRPLAAGGRRGCGALP